MLVTMIPELVDALLSKYAARCLFVDTVDFCVTNVWHDETSCRQYAQNDFKGWKLLLITKSFWFMSAESLGYNRLKPIKDIVHTKRFYEKYYRF